MAKTPVSILQELAEKEKFEIKYELMPTKGKETLLFYYRVIVGKFVAHGKGNSKKEAKHNSANAALKLLLDSGHQQEDLVNSIGLLNTFALENNLPQPTFKVLSEIGEPHSKLFTVECKIGAIGIQGTGTSKKKAKHAAAGNMLELSSEMKPKTSISSISFDDSISCEVPPEQTEITHIYNEHSLASKKKKTSCPTLVSSYPETVKFIMKDKDLSFEEIWSCEETEDLNQLKYVLDKLDLNISVKFMQGRKNTTIAFISLDTQPEFTLAEWGSTKIEALESAAKQTIDFLRIMTQ